MALRSCAVVVHHLVVLVQHLHLWLPPCSPCHTGHHRLWASRSASLERKWKIKIERVQRVRKLCQRLLFTFPPVSRNRLAGKNQDFRFRNLQKIWRRDRRKRAKTFDGERHFARSKLSWFWEGGDQGGKRDGVWVEWVWHAGLSRPPLIGGVSWLRRGRTKRKSRKKIACWEVF